MASSKSEGWATKYIQICPNQGIWTAGPRMRPPMNKNDILRCSCMMLKCVEYWYEISIHLPISVSNKYLLHLIEIRPFWSVNPLQIVPTNASKNNKIKYIVLMEEKSWSFLGIGRNMFRHDSQGMYKEAIIIHWLLLRYPMFRQTHISY